MESNLLNLDKCKAKRKDNGKWVSGYHYMMKDDFTDETIHIILSKSTITIASNEKLTFHKGGSYHIIDPNTICHHICSGISNGEEIDIWENDVLHKIEKMHSSTYCWNTGQRTEASWVNESDWIVKYTISDIQNVLRFVNNDNIRITKIGNIIDNPELQEEKDDINWGI